MKNKNITQKTKTIISFFILAMLFFNSTKAQLLLNALDKDRHANRINTYKQSFSKIYNLVQLDYVVDTLKNEPKFFSSSEIRKDSKEDIVKKIRKIELDKIEYNNYLLQEIKKLNENDKISYINNQKIDNSLVLIDSFSNKTNEERNKIVDAIINLKYESKKRYDYFRDYKSELDTLKKLINILNNFEPYFEKNTINQTIFTYLDNVEVAKKTYDSLQNKFLESHEFVKKELDKFNESNKKTEKPTLSKDDALKISNNFLNDLILTPTLSLIGSNSSTKRNEYREIGLSVGVVSDKVAQNNLSFFYADLSTFKINAGFNFYLKKVDTITEVDEKGQIGFNFELSYIGKRYFTDTSKVKESFNTTSFFLKTGVEVIIIDKILSGYSNVKAFSPVTGFEPFRKYKNTNKNIYAAIDFGFNFLLNPNSKSDGYNILLNLNFLINSNDVKTFSSYDGFLVPAVKIGFSKSLNVFGKKAVRNSVN